MEFKRNVAYNILNFMGKNCITAKKNDNMTTKPHSKIIETQENVKKVKSLCKKNKSVYRKFPKGIQDSWRILLQHQTKNQKSLK